MIAVKSGAESALDESICGVCVAMSVYAGMSSLPIEKHQLVSTLLLITTGPQL